MASDEDGVRLLQSIDRRLALLTASHEREMRRFLESELLRTPGRIAMFQGIDGVRGSSELAKFADVGERSAQLFVKELQELGLVREVPGGAGRAVIVELDETGITKWYLARSE